MRKNTFFENLKPEELVDSFVLPHGLNKLEKTKADASLMVVLNKKRALMAENKKLESNLLQFKFQLDDYVKSNGYKENFTFG